MDVRRNMTALERAMEGARLQRFYRLPDLGEVCVTWWDDAPERGKASRFVVFDRDGTRVAAFAVRADNFEEAVRAADNWALTRIVETVQVVGPAR